MENRELWKYVDHTLLKATATWDEIREICRETVEYGAASCCIPPCFVSRARDEFGPALNICTVIGFPLGYNSTDIKVREAAQALADGADEIDMVVNLGDVRAGQFHTVSDEIQAVKAVCSGRILKVIVETCYLTTEEKVALCGCVTEAGADFIKTSTGFGIGGATVADIELFAREVGPGVRIKAAGGVSTLDDFKAMIKAGATRIGTSRAAGLLGAKVSDQSAKGY